jgi:hypothetical protein
MTKTIQFFKLCFVFEKYLRGLDESSQSDYMEWSVAILVSSIWRLLPSCRELPQNIELINASVHNIVHSPV